MNNKYLILILSLVLPLLAGAIGSFFTTENIPTWYSGLEKATLNPPNWVFGPVWTVLYILMGIAFYIIWSKALDGKNIKLPVTIFIAQLVLNTFWSVAFFGMQNPLLGLLVIAILWILIATNIIVFYRLSKNAGRLLILYLLWVSFASYLNYAIWKLN